jgi:hypothetical protein
MDGHFRSLFGITLAEARKMAQSSDGHGSAEAVANEYRQIMAGNSNLGQMLTNNSTLSIAVDSTNTELYHIYPTNARPLLVSRPYETIGSGHDAADATLFSIVGQLRRQDRSDIPPATGVAALLEATFEASRRNAGVGGTPYITIVGKENIIEVHEENARLGMEIVTAARRDLLPRDYPVAVLPELVFRNGDFAAAEKEMWTVAKDKQALNHFLRGYKH